MWNELNGQHLKNGFLRTIQATDCYAAIKNNKIGLYWHERVFREKRKVQNKTYNVLQWEKTTVYVYK